MTSIRRRLAATVLMFGGAAALAMLLAPLLGSTPISLARVFDRSVPFADNVDAQIFWVARMPRVLAAAVVGAALAAAGVVLQALLRNPLATPFTLGVSAGAALGAMLAITFGSGIVLGPFSPVPLASFTGAMIATGLVYFLARRPGRALSTSVLLLAGVTLNSFFSALILFVQYIADFAEAYRTVRWLMGDLDIGAYEPIAGALPLVAISFGLFAVLPSSLTLLCLGGGVAAPGGVDVGGGLLRGFRSGSLATSAGVSSIDGTIRSRGARHFGAADVRAATCDRPGQRLAQPVGIDVEPARELHDVLVAHEVARVLAHHRERGLGSERRTRRRTAGRRQCDKCGEQTCGAIHP